MNYNEFRKVYAWTLKNYHATNELYFNDFESFVIGKEVKTIKHGFTRCIVIGDFIRPRSALTSRSVMRNVSYTFSAGHGKTATERFKAGRAYIQMKSAKDLTGRFTDGTRIKARSVVGSVRR